MKLGVRAAFGLALAWVAACGGSIATVGGSDSGATDSSSSQDGTTSTDGGVKKTCGVSSDCAPTDYCNLEGHCDFAVTKKGTCKPKPTACPDLYAPTCACDGKVYSNPCDTYAAGQDLNKDGTCAAPPGWISCGPAFCAKDVSFCIKSPNDAIDPNDPVKFYYQCSNLPAACVGQTSCACFPPNVPCSASQCSYKDGFTIMCPGG